MNYTGWHYGCRVTVSDWIGSDSHGKTPIRIGVEGFTPGSSILQPLWEQVIYCPRSEENKIRNNIDSITLHMILERGVNHER